MAYIDCVVDTEPMAREISTVSDKIKGTTAAVIGMKAAVVQAEADAADHVCENVNRGFYTLIHSQISQKIARLHSDVDSHLMKLNQLTKQLRSIKGRMQRDYNMISARYIKLFNGLNRNLEQRIFEIDRPVTDFALRDTNTISNRKRQLTAAVPVSQLESLALSQKILTSNLKYRGAKVIDSMKDFLADMEAQNELTGHILLDEQQEAGAERVMLPVIVSESDYDSHGNRQLEIYSGISGIDQKAQEGIRTAAGEQLAGFSWEDAPLDEEVRLEFNRLLASSDASQRVKEMAGNLFTASKVQTLKS
ncbi:MAG TPA: hypothetical protein IAC03_02440 [Candidatus Coprenecus pullistercoris]|nr:hypothetical protein [Candidatus Coprenecus pullistercoris]